jgi:hypothetical protein
VRAFDLALEGFVILLGIGVEILNLEETNLEHVLVDPKLGLNERHNGRRTVEENLIIAAN